MSSLTTHKKLAKIAAVILLIYGCTTAFYFAFIHRPIDYHVRGYYFPYYASHDSITRALMVLEDHDCQLLLNYAEPYYRSVYPGGRFIMDTITVDYRRKVSLVHIDCDSLVGLVEFENPFFNAKRRVSNINPVKRRGWVRLSDLHDKL